MADQGVYVRSAMSKTHIAVLHDGELLSSEMCNLDDLDRHSREVLFELPDLEPGDMCERCFPKATFQSEPETVTA